MFLMWCMIQEWLSCEKCPTVASRVFYMSFSLSSSNYTYVESVKEQLLSWILRKYEFVPGPNKVELC
jgi:hypothetical protein